MLYRISSALRDRTLDILADFVCIIIKDRLPLDLCPLVASASLSSLPKPAGSIYQLTVGLTLRCLADKVAMPLVNEEAS